MNVSFKELTHLFAHPQEYALELDGETFPLCADEAKVRRSNSNIEVAFAHNGESYLLTLPMMTGYLQHCQITESAIERAATTLFTDYRLDRRSLLRGESYCVAKMVIQHLPSGAPLTEYLDRADRDQIRHIYGAVTLLVEQLNRVRATFTSLSPDDIVVGDDGLLYPFRYQRLKFCRPTAQRWSRSLRSWIHGRYGVDPEEVTMPSGGYYHRDLYEGHLYSGTLHEDRVVVEDPTGYGFVDGDNRAAIPSIYIWADRFREGRAEVQTSDGFGLIDTDGREVIPTIYDSLAYNDDSGITAARKGGRWAYFSYCGEQLTPFTDDYPDEEITLSTLCTMMRAL